VYISLLVFKTKYLPASLLIEVKIQYPLFNHVIYLEIANLEQFYYLENFYFGKNYTFCEISFVGKLSADLDNFLLFSWHKSFAGTGELTEEI